MNEFLSFLKEYSHVLAAGFALVADLVIGSVVMFHSRLVKRALTKAKERDTYTICPHCHRQIKLSQIDFRLPSGDKDNDLDGKPDVE